MEISEERRQEIIHKILRLRPSSIIPVYCYSCGAPLEKIISTKGSMYTFDVKCPNRYKGLKRLLRFNPHRELFVGFTPKIEFDELTGQRVWRS